MVVGIVSGILIDHTPSKVILFFRKYIKPSYAHPAVGLNEYCNVCLDFGSFYKTAKMHYYISGYARYSDLGKIRKELLRKPMPVPSPPLNWLWEQALFTMHCELKKESLLSPQFHFLVYYNIVLNEG